MDIEASIEQVAGILVREGFDFDTSRDGRAYRLLFGSAAVFIRFGPWAKESVVITVSSPILQDVEPDSAGAARALNLLNQLNRTHYFLCFVFADGALTADYDLLADNLQAPELRNAILTVAGAADHLDDELIGEIGGKKYETLLDEWALESDEDD